MINEKMARTRRRAASAVKDLSDTLSEAQDLIDQAAAETGTRASNLRSQGASLLATATSRLRDLQNDAMDRAKATARVSDQYVRENPWQTVAAAAAVGFLLGVFVSRS